MDLKKPNLGARLCYVRDRDHAEFNMKYPNAGVMFSDNLIVIYEKIHDQWIQGDYCREDPHNTGVNHYFDGNGNFASVSFDFSQRAMTRSILPIFSVSFVSKETQHLKQIVESFSLPFDEKHVETD